MDNANCILCLKNISRNENTFSNGMESEFRNSQNDPLKNQLKIIFLLRKILEIPQDICCTFLKEYGDPCSWIGCCDSCSVLIQNGRHIFDQIMMLQNRFKTLQHQIKQNITATQMEGNFDEGKGRVEKIIRSYITKDNTVAKMEHTKNGFCQLDQNTSESSGCGFVATYNESDICVKNELENTDVFPVGVTIKVEGGDYHSGGNDPLHLYENEKVTNNNYDFGDDKERQHLPIILANPDQEFYAETTDMNSSIMFERNYEFEAANSQNIPSITVKANEIFHATNIKADRVRKPFKCLICGKGFRSSTDLNRHTVVHTGEKLFKCDICGKAFSQQNTLKVHQRIHTGEKPFECLICGQTFRNSNNLNRHTLIHTGEKRFKCEICGKAFPQHNTLKVHQKIHTGEKPYECVVCGCSFVNSNKLNRHMLIHTGERRFKCEICGKAFALSHHLKKHEKIHTGEKPYKCEFCGKDFAEFCALMAHLKIHRRQERSTQDCV